MLVYFIHKAFTIQSLKGTRMNISGINKNMVMMIPRKLIYFDVGARWGIGEPWKSFRETIQIIGFEPDEQEYRVLVGNRESLDVIHPYALYRCAKEIPFYQARSRGCSSIYRPNLKLLRKYPDFERFLVEHKVNAKAISLDMLQNQNILTEVDFVKIDVQGAELDVLIGGKNILNKNVLGIEVEVEFLPLYIDQPLFSEVDAFIRNSLRLQIQDIRKTYWKCKEGINIGSKKGQLIFGDALYFRPPEEIIPWCKENNDKGIEKKIVMACLMGIVYGYLDYSLCILSQPNIDKILDRTRIDRWKSVISAYGETLRFPLPYTRYLSRIFHLLYRLYQPTHKGWCSTGHHLGSRKKIGIFE